MSVVSPDGITHEAISVVADYNMARKVSLIRYYDGFTSGSCAVEIGVPRDLSQSSALRRSLYS